MPGSDFLPAADGKTEISYFPDLLSPQDVGRLDVPVDDSHGHEVLGGLDNIRHDGGSRLLSEPTLLGHVLKQITTFAEFSDKVGVGLGAVDEVEFDDVGVVKVLEDVDLVLEHLQPRR